MFGAGTASLPTQRKKIVELRKPSRLERCFHSITLEGLVKKTEPSGVLRSLNTSLTLKVIEKGDDQMSKALNNDSNKSRRNFLKYFFGGSLMAFAFSVFYPIVKYLKPPKSSEPVPTSVIAGQVGELKPNSGKIFRFGNEPGILINTPKGELRAFTAICTHLACTVQYRADYEHIWCACHDGHYNLNGINIKGPPPRPLAKFKVNIKGEQIFASKEN